MLLCYIHTDGNTHQLYTVTRPVLNYTCEQSRERSKDHTYKSVTPPNSRSEIPIRYIIPSTLPPSIKFETDTLGKVKCQSPNHMELRLVTSSSISKLLVFDDGL